MRCIYCNQRVYLVQNAKGERFLVATETGKRLCEANPARHSLS
jgi:hypothetical protein